jgi:uracil-DNA glycosylase
MKILLETGWKKQLEEEFEKNYFKDLHRALTHAYTTRTIFPAESLIFNALNLCPLEKTRVVILGQDPYHGAGQAHGLAFSVPDSEPIPPSLRNIFKEVATDIGIEPTTQGNLTRWAKQGVLLLNSSLTVEQGQAASHTGWGWETFTDAVIKKISAEKTNVVFLLWGKHAHTKEGLIDSDKHLVLKAAHPSPLSAFKGFFGCRHFSKTNSYLNAHNIPPITW